MLEKIGNLVSLIGEWGEAAQLELDARGLARVLTQSEQLIAQLRTINGQPTPTQTALVERTDRYTVITQQATLQLQNIADHFPGEEAAADAISQLPQGVLTPTNSLVILEVRTKALRSKFEQLNRATTLMKRDLLERTLRALTFWK